MLNDSVRPKIIQHLSRGFSEQDCLVRVIDGTTDHLHSLFLLSQNYSIAQVLKNVKGESSHWINQQKFFLPKFAWQVGYAAFSVSESLLSKVDKYIRNQKQHHQKMTFAEELQKLLKLHGLSENR